MGKACWGALLLASVVGLGSPLTGTWRGDLCLFPSQTFSNEFSLELVGLGWSLRTVSSFDLGGFHTQRFGIRGTFGPVQILGNMTFNPLTPAYTRSDLTATLMMEDLRVSLRAEHLRGVAFGCPTGTAFTMRYTLSASARPVTARFCFVDCCTGIAFYNAFVSLTRIPLCCGVSWSGTLSFTKAGFEKLVVIFSDLPPLCCNVRFDLFVTFRPDSKEVELIPRITGLVDVCVALFGDVVWDADTHAWKGIAAHGFRIKCVRDECTFAEFMTAFDPLAPSVAWLFDPACGEFEYVKLSFCAPGCCGGRYTLDVTAYFGTLGGLMDLTRIVVKAEVPLFSRWIMKADVTLAASPCVTTRLCFGWNFAF